jgi:SAM-dependent methyltransferase
MYERHRNRVQYFGEQDYTTRKYVIPYIGRIINIGKDTTVLEIGCGEGGNLKPFMDMGCKITGIDLSPGKIELAHSFFADHENRKNLTLICDNIYNRNNPGKFDLIMLRDVIEHIPEQERFMGFMKNFLKKGSVIFFGFPPWQNPFGGHQQVCRNKILAKLPYFHLLPRFLYRGILQLFGETSATVQNLMEVKQTGISIDRFEKILKKHGFKIEDKTLYLINPNYETKFKLKPKKQNRLIGSVPWLRNFFTTAAYYVISDNNL